MLLEFQIIIDLISPIRLDRDCVKVNVSKPVGHCLYIMYTPEKMHSLFFYNNPV